MAIKSKTKDIRVTKQYVLFEGYDQTANMFAVVRKATKTQTLGMTTFMPAIQKDELIKLTDDDFDIACGKFTYS